MGGAIVPDLDFFIFGVGEQDRDVRCRVGGMLVVTFNGLAGPPCHKRFGD